MADLSKYNGPKGTKAYLGFNGFVYDATNCRVFKDGVHIFDPNVKAGMDITNAFVKYAPQTHLLQNIFLKTQSLKNV